ncbi:MULTISPECIES: hypothetical protein [Deefgea]|uniref:C2H2-type domain-containing protein n=1 Tax=Deefgea chitinilytica TaxID=570276 RepID=A0ABS2C8S6_9NEIS|nr:MULTISPECIES: hypothetical protein [Deefgea]MBM5570554.1 hypothetical protein [Deefgea chitinilytica]MBM9887783.1 hypothetical protein [Deefgea sp. CFH1-16]
MNNMKCEKLNQLIASLLAEIAQGRSAILIHMGSRDALEVKIKEIESVMSLCKENEIIAYLNGCHARLSKLPLKDVATPVNIVDVKLEKKPSKVKKSIPNQKLALRANNIVKNKTNSKYKQKSTRVTKSIGRNPVTSFATAVDVTCSQRSPDLKRLYGLKKTAQEWLKMQPYDNVGHLARLMRKTEAKLLQLSHSGGLRHHSAKPIVDCCPICGERIPQTMITKHIEFSHPSGTSKVETARTMQLLSDDKKHEFARYANHSYATKPIESKNDLLGQRTHVPITQRPPSNPDAHKLPPPQKKPKAKSNIPKASTANTTTPNVSLCICGGGNPECSQCGGTGVVNIYQIGSQQRQLTAIKRSEKDAGITKGNFRDVIHGQFGSMPSYEGDGKKH